MLLDTVDKKNEKILSRFESRQSSTKTFSLRVNMIDGKSFTAICVNGESLEDAKNDIFEHFGKNRILSIL